MTATERRHGARPYSPAASQVPHVAAGVWILAYSTGLCVARAARLRIKRRSDARLGEQDDCGKENNEARKTRSLNGRYHYGCTFPEVHIWLECKMPASGAKCS
jgi:hypothetical protein